jgi:hypothetical protein
MWLRMLIAGACAGLVSACAVVDPVDNRADTVARSLAKTRNESIFLNLVRASHDYPLSFVVVNQVSPSMSNTTNVGLPNFLLGPHIPIYPGIANTSSSGLFTPGRDVIFNNSTASNTTLVSTNFNVSTQETSAFYSGFLKPIDLQTLNYFIRQGYPREMLFWLFTDSFELSMAGKTAGYHYSPPDDYGCNRDDPKHRCFIDWVHIATLTGLTVEEATLKTKEASKPSTYSRFCFNSVLAQQAKALMSPQLVASLTRQLDIPITAVFGPTTKCGGTWDPTENADKPQPDILPITVGPFTFRIIPRSAYGVFEFLGSVMKLEREALLPGPDTYISPGRSQVTEPPVLATVHDDQALISVVKSLGGECFVHTWFNDGDYCVPEQAATTKRIFGLLAQLIAIQTAASDLSITPIVRIAQ